MHHDLLRPYYNYRIEDFEINCNESNYSFYIVQQLNFSSICIYIAHTFPSLFDSKIITEPTKLLNSNLHLNPQDLIQIFIDNKMLKQA